jgi:aryl-alcohol dehydrogenase-like predicted oxidoreductase
MVMRRIDGTDLGVFPLCLVHRKEYEGDLRDVCAHEGLGCLPYYALAKGFLTGKYRPDAHVDSVRATAARGYLDAHGLEMLATLDDVAASHHATVAAVSLAWLLAQPTIVAPIASARTVEQLTELLPAATLTLTDDEVARLSSLGG